MMNEYNNYHKGMGKKKGMGPNHDKGVGKKKGMGPNPDANVYRRTNNYNFNNNFSHNNFSQQYNNYWYSF